MFRSQRGTIIVAASTAIAVLATAVGAVFLAPARTLSGQVIDATTGKPLVEAVVKAGDKEFRVGEDGAFTITGLRFGSSIVAEAKGHQPASSMVTFGDQLRLTLDPRVLEGAISDSSGGKPVKGVQVVAGDQVVQADDQGRFKLVGIDPGTEVVVRASGFGPLTLKYDGQSTAQLVLKPNVLTVKAINKFTRQPVEGAEASDGHTTVRTDKQGQARLQYLPEGTEVTVKLEGFSPYKVTYSGQDSADVLLQPDTVTGVVKDPKGQPLASATVSDGHSTVATDQQGNFKISGLQENAALLITAPGYGHQQAKVGDQSSLDITLRPFLARGVYLTFYGVGDQGLTGHVLQLADSTEINTVVIDIKGDRGWIAYKSDVPMVQQIGAQQEIMIKDPKNFLAELKKRGVYTIARIVTFKDNPLATARPDLAVINSATGKPWVDNEGLRWADPTLPEVWDYNIALATEAIDNGFDEVQFDYVRFPTDASAGNSLDAITFSQPNRMANRTAAINGFLEKAKQAIHAHGGVVSADIFGYVVWRDDDMGIGQHLEDVAQHVDYVSPMLYPTLFWDGIAMEGGAKYGNQRAGLYPYEIVNESMKVAVKRIGADKLRPWLQYYNDYLTGKSYTAGDVEAQKQATYETGVHQWLFWDPSNRFDRGGFDSKQGG